MSSNSRAPRKTPVQRRSSITVEAILEAAVRIFTEFGYAAATTSRVADRAGVSVGSLYQYFPNKLSMLAGTKQRYVQKLFAQLEQVFAKATHLDPGMRAAIGVNIRASLEARALLLICAEELPARLRGGEELPSNAPHVVMLRRFFQKCRSEIPDRDPQLAALVVGEMVDAITRAALHDRPDDMRNGVLERELMAAVMLYLGGRQHAPRSRHRNSSRTI